VTIRAAYGWLTQQLRTGGAGVQASDGALWDGYDVALLDLDGVVYVGSEAVPGAVDHLAAARQAGLHVAYVTNNASRTPDAVADHLRELGIEALDEDVVTSAQAAARMLSGRLPSGSAVFVIGGRGLEVALSEEGLRPVQDRDEQPAAVVSGFSAELRWGTVIAGAILVREGLPWVASNTDLTVPTPDGPGPGNGALVGVVARFAERQPDVAGKPESPLFEETLRRVGGERPLVVGDRLDTDIEGANRIGYDSLLVMTGVTDLATLVAAPPELRPTYIGSDLGALGRPHPAPQTQDGAVTAGCWRASVVDGRLRVDGAPDSGHDGQDSEVDAWWLAAATAAWAHLDEHDSAPDVSDLRPPGSVSDQSEDAEEAP
jgi:HAD superfamily hydrolase (TIGR01450 family)